MQNSTYKLPPPQTCSSTYACVDECHHLADQAWESILMTPDFHFSSQMAWIYSSKYPPRPPFSTLLPFWFHYQSKCRSILVGHMASSFQSGWFFRCINLNITCLASCGSQASLCTKVLWGAFVKNVNLSSNPVILISVRRNGTQGSAF